MGGMVGGESKSHGRGKKKNWKKPRVSIRVDMTPMVDVAFLLLIFFMVTTVFRLPQAMEINLPPDSDPVETKIKQSRILNFNVDNSNRLFFSIGDSSLRLLQWDSLESKLLERKKAKDTEGKLIGQNLIVVAKFQPQSPFKAMVDLIDQFNVDSVTRYSVAKWDTTDDRRLEEAIVPVK